MYLYICLLLYTVYGNVSMLVNISFSACKPESFSTGTDWTFGFQACMYTYTIICNICLHFEYLYVYM